MMKPDDMAAKIAQSPVFEIRIRFSPATGQVQCQWAGNDQILNLGLLELAKAQLVAMLVQASQNKGVVVAPASALSQ